MNKNSTSHQNQTESSEILNPVSVPSISEKKIERQLEEIRNELKKLEKELQARTNPQNQVQEKASPSIDEELQKISKIEESIQASIQSHLIDPHQKIRRWLICYALFTLFLVAVFGIGMHHATSLIKYGMALGIVTIVWSVITFMVYQYCHEENQNFESRTKDYYGALCALNERRIKLLNS